MGPRHAGECYHSLALRARRAPQNDPLARTACLGRAAPPGAPPRLALQRSRPPQCLSRTRFRWAIAGDSPAMTEIGGDYPGLDWLPLGMETTSRGVAFRGPP